MKSENLEKIKCPCCGQTVVEIFDICDICGWQNDRQQSENPNYTGGANRMSLNQAKKAWLQGEPVK